jgi:hypothetical protein
MGEDERTRQASAEEFTGPPSVSVNEILAEM